jgi:hypothetical protein
LDPGQLLSSVRKDSRVLANVLRYGTAVVAAYFAAAAGRDLGGWMLVFAVPVGGLVAWRANGTRLHDLFSAGRAGARSRVVRKVAADRSYDFVEARHLQAGDHVHQLRRRPTAAAPRGRKPPVVGFRRVLAIASTGPGAITIGFLDGTEAPCSAKAWVEILPREATARSADPAAGACLEDLLRLLDACADRTTGQRQVVGQLHASGRSEAAIRWALRAAVACCLVRRVTPFVESLREIGRAVLGGQSSGRHGDNSRLELSRTGALWLHAGIAEEEGPESRPPDAAHRSSYTVHIENAHGVQIGDHGTMYRRPMRDPEDEPPRGPS